MIKNIIFSLFILLAAACSENQPVKQVLFDPASHDAYYIKSFHKSEVHSIKGTLQVQFNAGACNPVIGIYPKNGIWNASEYRFLRCELENLNNRPQLVELGIGDYDLTLGATILPAKGKRILKAIIYRTDHPAYIDSVFPVMHGKPDGILRGWMASTSDTIESIRLIFPEARSGDSVRIGKIWLEGSYELMSENELKEKFYPFVDKFGQYMYADWPNKINTVEDLQAHDEKEMADLSIHQEVPGWNRYGGWKNGPVRPQVETCIFLL